MANEPAKEAPAAATTAAPTEVKKEEVAAPAKKVSKKEAKEACLKEHADLKGKDLNKCVKEKTM
jgi:hypothetical protein